MASSQNCSHEPSAMAAFSDMRLKLGASAASLPYAIYISIISILAGHGRRRFPSSQSDADQIAATWHTMHDGNEVFVDHIKGLLQ